MSKKHRRSSQKPISELLNGFVEDRQKIVGATDSAHKLEVGTYNGQVVTVKPFRSKRGVLKAQNEYKISKIVAEQGFRTIEPIEVRDFKRQLVTLLIAKYQPHIVGAHTLSHEADPDSATGEALQKPLGAIATQLGELHGAGFTHGDPQIKNFGFSSPAIDANSEHQPVVFDWENGVKHSSHNGDFKDNVSDDIARLTYSLGTRQFGGQDHDTASQIVREAILSPYIESPVSEAVGSLIMPHMIDHAQANFMAGRHDKELIDKRHIHTTRVAQEFSLR